MLKLDFIIKGRVNLDLKLKKWFGVLMGNIRLRSLEFIVKEAESHLQILRNRI